MAPIIWQNIPINISKANMNLVIPIISIKKKYVNPEKDGFNIARNKIKITIW